MPIYPVDLVNRDPEGLNMVRRHSPPVEPRLSVICRERLKCPFTPLTLSTGTPKD